MKLKYQKVYNQLEDKAFYTQCRMPNLNRVALLLKEIGIECEITETYCYKQTKSEGLRYYTGGGTRRYEGFHLYIPSIKLRIRSTDTYYSWNNSNYAREIVLLVDQVLEEKYGIIAQCRGDINYTT